MADIGQILYLPPPVANGRAAAIPTDERLRRPVPAIDSDTAGSQARAKQFRFRVYDGGRRDEAQPHEAMAGDNGLPTRRAGNARSDEARPDAAQSGAAQKDRSRHETGGQRGQAFLATASAPFLAQLIAQEQMQAGLHDPPLRAADRAYRQAGGEPALSKDGGPAGFRSPRFQIAV